MYKLSENFLTLNSYISAEINDHCLALVIFELTDRPEDLKPWHTSSQLTESYFRLVVFILPLQHRISIYIFIGLPDLFSSSGSTQVNFTARDCFVTRFARADAHIALTAKRVKDGFNFPRFTRAPEDTRSHPRLTMPRIDQINYVHLRSRNDAENALTSLGKKSEIINVVTHKLPISQTNLS
jgi:hypothetical protein